MSTGVIIVKARFLQEQGNARRKINLTIDGQTQQQGKRQKAKSKRQKAKGKRQKKQSRGKIIYASFVIPRIAP
jgi:uncharacterized protein YjbJ (UPF0337 family)